MNKNPLISIISVTYNAEKYLEKTIQSVINQSFTNYEYIVIDGNSKDGTLNIVKKYSEKISRWISEPDKGLYDAMNKGLKIAEGEYVWFLNAGDLIFDNTTLNSIFKIKSVPDVYYGQTMIIDEHGNDIGLRRLKPPENFTWKDYRYGQLICHQSFIPKRELCPLYDLNFKHSADTDWQLKILRKTKSLKDTELILSRYLDGGQSKQTIIPSLRERLVIMIRNYGFFITIISHVKIAFKFLKFLLVNRRF